MAVWIYKRVHLDTKVVAETGGKGRCIPLGPILRPCEAFTWLSHFFRM